MSAIQSQIDVNQIDATQVQNSFLNFQTLAQSESQQSLGLQDQLGGNQSNSAQNSLAVLASSMANAALLGLQQM
jgi:hypothetical protein